MNATYKRAPQGRGEGVQSLMRQVIDEGCLDDFGVDEREADKEIQRQPYTNIGENHD